jgi:hypothetical protein
MLRSIAFLAFALAALAGCTQPCDHDHLCALDVDNALCDGSNYLVCDATVRGKTVACGNGPRVAVCTPDGWTFENSAPP